MIFRTFSPMLYFIEGMFNSSKSEKRFQGQEKNNSLVVSDEFAAVFLFLSHEVPLAVNYQNTFQNVFIELRCSKQ